MKRILLAAAGLALASPALAKNCPNEIKAIDAALQTASADKKDAAQKLRDEADAAHKAGNHAASMKASGEAKQLLGIKSTFVWVRKRSGGPHGSAPFAFGWSVPRGPL